MRVAALDLGTNTFLLLIADMQGRDLRKVVVDESKVTRLGQGVHQARAFSPEALARAENCLAEYAAIIKKFGAEKIIAVATSAARDVTNREVFLALGEKYGIPIRVISGTQEAEVSFEGATADLKLSGTVAVIDVGGGSTEIIGRSETGQVLGQSVDVGAVRLTEMFIHKHPVVPEELQALEAYVRERMAAVEDKLPGSADTVVAVAGTPTTLAALESGRDFDEPSIHRSRMKTARIREWRDRLATMTVEQRQALPGMQINRADVIVAGATILVLAAERLGVREITISTKGVRYGVARSWQSF